MPTSKSVTLPAGIYEWQASYSGDTNNDPSMSKFEPRRRWWSPYRTATTAGTGDLTAAASPCRILSPNPPAPSPSPSPGTTNAKA